MQYYSWVLRDLWLNSRSVLRKRVQTEVAAEKELWMHYSDFSINGNGIGHTENISGPNGRHDMRPSLQFEDCIHSLRFPDLDEIISDSLFAKKQQERFHRLTSITYDWVVLCAINIQQVTVCVTLASYFAIVG